MMRARAPGQQLDTNTKKGQWRRVYGMECRAQADHQLLAWHQSLRTPPPRRELFGCFCPPSNRSKSGLREVPQPSSKHRSIPRPRTSTRAPGALQPLHNFREWVLCCFRTHGICAIVGVFDVCSEAAPHLNGRVDPSGAGDTVLRLREGSRLLVVRGGWDGEFVFYVLL